VSQAIHPAQPGTAQRHLGRPGKGKGTARQALAASVAGFPHALHAEWTKARTLAGTWWLLAAVAALTITVSAATAAAYHCPPGATGPHGACGQAQTGADLVKISLTGTYLGQVVLALLGVTVIGGEYGTGMIRLTLTAAPARLTMLAAKAVVVTGLGLAAAAISVGGSLLAGRLILPGRGLSPANGYLPLSLGTGPELRAAVGTVLYLVLIALLALGLTTAFRDSAAGIGIALGLLFLFPIAAGVIPDHVLARHLNQIAPMTTGFYVQATVGVRSLPLAPWQGLGVTAAWAGGALLLGAAVLRLRDA
jgi:ABC-2 type transport system permease protein